MPPQWDEDEPSATEKYRRERHWKEKLHTSLRTRFALTEYADIQRCLQLGASFPHLLLQRIAEQGRQRYQAPSQWDVRLAIELLKAEQADQRHWQIAVEIDAWIRASRQQVKSDFALHANFFKKDTVEETAALFRLARPVMERYVQHLESTHTVDHEGTILKAWQYLRDNTVRPQWKVVLIDEYQDVNPAQAAFVHALLKPVTHKLPSSGARLTAVGDDWQAIFGFQGGDVDLIRCFNDPAETHQGFSERIELKQSHRFGQAIADSTRQFVIQGKGAIARTVIGRPELDPDARWPASIILASTRLTREGERRLGKRHAGLTAGVLAVLIRIGEQCEDADVLIVARRNADLQKPEMLDNEGPGIDRRTIGQSAARLGVSVTYSTVHKAKGTEADYVILLDTGPPHAGRLAANRVLDRALRVFRGHDTADEEERRIWYVALTRAKRKVYIIVDGDRHSLLADELYYNKNGHYDVGEDELAEFLEPMRPMVPCPVCIKKESTTAVLAMRAGHSGYFVGCTSYDSGSTHHCGHTERACGHCGQGLMIRIGNGLAQCQAPNCKQTVPLCRGTTPRPMVVRTNRRTDIPFWGCQRYGTKRSCKWTVRKKSTSNGT